MLLHAEGKGGGCEDDGLTLGRRLIFGHVDVEMQRPVDNDVGRLKVAAERREQAFDLSL